MSWRYIITFDENTPALCHSIFTRWWDKFHANINLATLPILLRPTTTEISKLTSTPAKTPIITPLSQIINSPHPLAPSSSQKLSPIPKLSSSSESLPSPLSQPSKESTEKEKFLLSPLSQPSKESTEKGKAKMVSEPKLDHSSQYITLEKINILKKKFPYLSELEILEKAYDYDMPLVPPSPPILSQEDIDEIILGLSPDIRGHGQLPYSPSQNSPSQNVGPTVGPPRPTGPTAPGSDGGPYLT